MANSDHTAVGQALGYIYQFERATYRLLEADNRVVSVGIEHIDDISVHKLGGSIIREQNKASIKDNFSITDNSVSLWKTLAIWVGAAVANPEILSNTEFHLVTNGSVKKGCLAARIHGAQTPAKSNSLAKELLTIAAKTRDDLKKFANKIAKVPPETLSAVIRRIYVFDRVCPAFGGKLEDLQCLRLLGPLQRAAIFDNAAGWVRRTILAAAQGNQPTTIDRAAFDKELKALFRRVAVAPLAVVFENDDSSIDPANYRSYGFFQQLDWIDMAPDFVRDCVIHYVQAQSARIKWTDADAVSEASLRAYEDDLKTRWKLHALKLSHKTHTSPIAAGQERLISTLSEDSALDGQPMPKVITCGSYHVLANFDNKRDPEVGWHPEFESMAKAAKANGAKEKL
jgi:hypothetical protein